MVCTWPRSGVDYLRAAVVELSEGGSDSCNMHWDCKLGDQYLKLGVAEDM